MDEGLKAVIQASTFASAGKLNTAQAKEFADKSVDLTFAIKECDVHKMVTSSESLDSLDMAARQMRKHVVNTKGTGATLNPFARVLETVEAKIWFPIDFSVLERETIESDGKLEQGRLLKKIMEIGEKKFGNDIEDLAWNGDTAYAGTSDKEFKNTADGWLKIAKANAIPYDLDSSVDWLGTIFPNMWDSLPDEFKADPENMRFYTSKKIESQYRRQLASVGGSAGLPYILDAKRATFEEVPVIGVPKLPAGHVLLTHRLNLAYGIDVRNISRDFDRYAVARVLEAVLFAPIAFQIADIRAAVIGYEMA